MRQTYNITNKNQLDVKGHLPNLIKKVWEPEVEKREAAYEHFLRCMDKLTADKDKSVFGFDIISSDTIPKNEAHFINKAGDVLLIIKDLKK